MVVLWGADIANFKGKLGSELNFLNVRRGSGLAITHSSPSREFATADLLTGREMIDRTRVLQSEGARHRRMLAEFVALQDLTPTLWKVLLTSELLTIGLSCPPPDA